MIQTHTIILWKKAEDERKPFETIAREAYEVMSIFQEYQSELRPNYLRARRKKDAKEMEWDYENFKELLRKGVNKEGNHIFEDLGYSMGFFSSKDDDWSSSFSLHVGCKKQRFLNTFIIDLPLAMDFYDEETAKIIKNLFERLVNIFNPFWGCVSNNLLSDKCDRFLEDSSPGMIHWLNYWSEEIIETVGVKRIQKVVKRNKNVTFEKGILMVGERAFDVEDRISMEFHDKMQTQLLSL